MLWYCLSTVAVAVVAEQLLHWLLVAAQELGSFVCPLMRLWIGMVSLGVCRRTGPSATRRILRDRASPWWSSQLCCTRCRQMNG
jgi:hypothetical protein